MKIRNNNVINFGKLKSVKPQTFSLNNPVKILFPSFFFCKKSKHCNLLSLIFYCIFILRKKTDFGETIFILKWIKKNSIKLMIFIWQIGLFFYFWIKSIFFLVTSVLSALCLIQTFLKVHSFTHTQTLVP